MAKTYESYKDSGIAWIGEIPSEWKVSRYKFYTTNRMGETILASDTTDVGIPIYSATQDDSIFGYIQNPKVILKKGDIVIPARGNSIGYATQIKDEIATCSQTTICSTNIHGINSRFLFYCIYGLKDDWFRYDGSAIPQITVDQVKNNVLPLPSKQEQHSIASFLDTKCGEIDSLISLQEEMISELQAYKQSVITEAVTKGLDPNAKMNCCASREKNDACISSSETQPAIERKFKDSGVEWIGEIPETWKYAKLKNIINYIESGVSVNAGLEEVGPNDIGVLKTSSVSKNVFIPYECKKVFENEINRVSCPVKANTIIVSRMNTPELVGACGYVDRDYDNIFLPDRLWQVHFIESVYVKYYWYYLISKRTKSYFSSLSSGTSSSMQNISQPQFQGAPIAVPPLSEQQAIASYLDVKTSQIDSLISLKQQKIDEPEVLQEEHHLRIRNRKEKGLSYDCRE